MLYLISLPNNIKIFVKAENEEEAIAIFNSGFNYSDEGESLTVNELAEKLGKSKEWVKAHVRAVNPEKYTKHPDFVLLKIENLNQFLEFVPKEFMIEEDCSF